MSPRNKQVDIFAHECRVIATARALNDASERSQARYSCPLKFAYLMNHLFCPYFLGISFACFESEPKRQETLFSISYGFGFNKIVRGKSAAVMPMSIQNTEIPIWARVHTKVAWTSFASACSARIPPVHRCRQRTWAASPCFKIGAKFPTSALNVCESLLKKNASPLIFFLASARRGD